MNRSRVPIMLALIALVLTACSGPDAVDQPVGEDRPPTGPAPIIAWGDPDVVTDLGGGWTITDCVGDGPFLCVFRDGTPVGVVETAAYPIASFDGLDPSSDPDRLLDAFVAGFHETFSTDRAEGCGEDYRVDPLGPAGMVLGGTPGVSFGFAGSWADGTASELNLQYATVVGDHIVTIAAIAYDVDGCPGRDDLSTWDSASLGAFRERLEAALPDSPLPGPVGPGLGGGER